MQGRVYPSVFSERLSVDGEGGAYTRSGSWTHTDEDVYGIALELRVPCQQGDSRGEGHGAIERRSLRSFGG
jgi:hypothetical protein